MISIRTRTRVPQEELDLKVGKVLGPDSYNVLLTGPTRVYRPNGALLCVYLPGAMKGYVTPEQYDIFHGLRSIRTNNRGNASGSQAMHVGTQKRQYWMHVSSNIIGSFDPAGSYKFCRLTSWTGSNLPAWQALQPALQRVGDQFAEHVPDRYEAQMEEIRLTHPDWVVPGTPFTTVTVNNTYPTGMHQDKGDLDKGFSTIFTLRRGSYTGGVFMFPEFRLGVDLQDGDLILMDAHQWHANSAITCACDKRITRYCEDCGAERISVVSYMRTNMVRCASEAEEIKRAQNHREKFKGAGR
jgi:hypothetical protein